MLKILKKALASIGLVFSFLAVSYFGFALSIVSFSRGGIMIKPDTFFLAFLGLIGFTVSAALCFMYIFGTGPLHVRKE